MPESVSLIAAIGIAVLNGLAAILQKKSADHARIMRSIDLKTLFKVVRDTPYALGILLEVGAGVLTFVALYSLPLFLVQSISAASIAVTALIERVVYRTELNRQAYLLILLMLAGLSALGSVALPSKVGHIDQPLRIIILSVPALLAILTFIFLRARGAWSASALAAISGVGFGGTAIIARMLSYHAGTFSLVLHLLTNPLIWAVAAYGGIGLYAFTLALQRGTATKANAVMVATQTLVPTAWGLAFLDDQVRAGLWEVGLIGAVAVVAGSIWLGLAAPTARRH